VADLTPQIGIRGPGANEFRYFTEDEFVRDEQLGIEKGSTFKIIGLGKDGSERMIGLLRQRVPTLLIGGTLPPLPPSDGEIIIAVTGIVDALLARAIAKIAFNYMTYFAGPDFALNEAFGVVRRFVRYGEGGWRDVVRVSTRPILANDAVWYGAVRGHLVTVAWPGAARTITSNVSLFNEAAYVVTLARRCDAIWRPLRFGHLFNWETREITKLTTASGLSLPWQTAKF